MKLTQQPVASALAVLLLFFSIPSYSQFDFSAQIIQRSEFRNGYGQLIGKGTDPAVFISYRARLQFEYKVKKLRLYSSIQDVRTFGNTPQIKLNDPFLSVHEAYADILADSSWAIRIGRQELNYDNFRFLGNLDWALQARAHDFILIKYENNALKVHVGGGYNQDNEKLAGGIFTTGNQYKTAQLARIEYGYKNFDFSFLFWNDGRQFVVKDSADKVISKGVRFKQTIGLPMLRYRIGNTTIGAFYYHQLGKDVSNKTMNAFDASLFVSQRVPINKEKKTGFTFTLGTEVISGTATNNTSQNNFSFSPLYGTNHAHNGYMDMFFVGGRFENSVGLYDAFLRIKYDVTSNIFLSLNTHYFNAYAKVYNNTENLNPYLGTELDFTFGYKIIESVSIQAGYSHLLQSNTMNVLEKVAEPNEVQNWAYLMLVYRPFSDKKFIGLLF